MMLPNKITIVRIQSADNLTFAEMSLDQFYERVSNEMKPVIRIPVAQSIRYSARLDNVDSIDETDRVFFKRYEHAKRQFAGIDGSFDVLMIIYQEKIQAKQENNKGWLRI